jgi:hypothetical protein
MTPAEVLANAFYSFWYVLGDHFTGILAMGLFFTLLLAWYYLMFKK